jgi:hypothetical protein
VAVTVAPPVLVPSQFGFVLVAVAVIAGGSVRVVLLVAVQPWLSVTVTV